MFFFPYTCCRGLLIKKSKMVQREMETESKSTTSAKGFLATSTKTFKQ